MIKNNTIHFFYKTLLFKLFFIIILFNASCKKETIHYVEDNDINEFFAVSKNASPEINFVIKILRDKLKDNDFSQNFLVWHGMPKWDKSLKVKFENLSSGYNIMIIPVLKKDSISAFIAATITPQNKVLFELHRWKSIQNKINEFSYVGFNTKNINFYFEIFRRQLNKIHRSEGNNSTEDYPTLCDTYCWYTWQLCIVQKNSYMDTSITSDFAIPKCWVEHCETACDPPGGGGGGSGGSTCPTCPTTPPDCPNSLWYSVAPIEDPCPTLPPPLSPCERVVQGCKRATDLFKSDQPNMIQRKSEMLALSSLNKEYVFWFGKTDTSNSTYSATGILSSLDDTSIPIYPYAPSSMSLPLTYGAEHLHTMTGFSAPSPADIYNFRYCSFINPLFTNYLVLSPSNNEYAFIIHDTVAFHNFGIMQPFLENIDSSGNWISTTEFYKISNDVYRYFIANGKTDDEAFELAHAFALKKFNVGLTLAKRDSFGNFKPIFVDEMIDPGDTSKKLYYQTIICNLINISPIE